MTEIISGCCLGIDPGLDGALAVLPLPSHNPETLATPTVGQGKRDLDMPAIRRWLENVEETHGEIRLAAIEKVHSMPKQGVASTFKFGMGFGKIQGILAGLQIPFILVSPQAWKASVLTGLNWKHNKAASIAYCGNRWPGVDLRRTERCKCPHDGISDALCLAVYAKSELEF